MEKLIIALVAASPTQLSVVAVSVATMVFTRPCQQSAELACTVLHWTRPRLAARSFYCIAVVTSQTVECRSQPRLQTAMQSGAESLTGNLRKISSPFIKLDCLLRESDYGDPARGAAGFQHAGRGQPVLQLDPLPGLLHTGQLHLHTGIVQKF